METLFVNMNSKICSSLYNITMMWLGHGLIGVGLLLKLRVLCKWSEFTLRVNCKHFCSKECFTFLKTECM